MMSLMPPKLTSPVRGGVRGAVARLGLSLAQVFGSLVYACISLGLSFCVVLMNAHIKLHLSSLSVSDTTNGFPSTSTSLSLSVLFSLCFLAAYENIIRYSPRTVNERSSALRGDHKSKRI